MKLAAGINNGMVESQGLFRDPKINFNPTVAVDAGNVAGHASGVSVNSSGFLDFFDPFFYFIYMIFRIPLDILSWIFGINTHGGYGEFFKSLLSGDGVFAYFGYFFKDAPFSKLFGTGIGKNGGYLLIPDTYNPFVIIKNFFVNPFGGPSFAEIFFGGVAGWWWISSLILLYFLMYWRKKIKAIDKKVEEEYDNPEEFIEEYLFHDKEKKKRWAYILELLKSEEENDWKKAVILADALLDDVFESHKMIGELKEIFAKVNMKNSFKVIKVKDISKKIRNNADFIVEKKKAKEILDNYSIIFKELYYI